MTETYRPWQQWAARLLMAALLAVMTPLSMMAGEKPNPASSPPTLSGALDKAAAEEAVATVPKAVTVARQESGGPNLRSWSFFKTPVGVTVIAVVAFGTGLALWSTRHDRISSPGR